MILHTSTPQRCPRQDDRDGESRQRRLSLLRCLERMGFYDPEGLLADSLAAVTPASPLPSQPPLPPR